MDEKNTAQNDEQVQDFDLDDILNEFHEGPASDQIPEPVEIDDELSSILSEFGVPQEQPASEEASGEASGEAPAEAPAEEAAAPQGEEASEEAPEEVSGEIPEAAGEQPAPEVSQEATQLISDFPVEAEEAPAEESVQPEDGESGETIRIEEPEAQEEAPHQEPLVYDPRAQLRELKRKLVAGPEKRYYALSELGLGKLQVAILVNLIIVVLCAGAALLYAMDLVPENRMRLLIFSQALAMLISALLGANQLIDGFSELFHGRFTINTTLALTLIACAVDAAFCLRDLRVPCCAAFSLEMTMALCARYQKRNTEMGQMDTLRKAVRLKSIVKQPDFFQGLPGLLRGEGQLEDFWDIYEKSSGPQKLQSFYAFLSFLLSIAVSVLAGVLHGPGLAVQILATSLLVSVPASYFIALTRPASILERRLHMVGTVLCGWQGVKGLSDKAVFPIQDSDMFPNGSTKLNGVKFYSDRDPDMIVSYTASLILEAGGGLVPVFQQLMTSRGVAQNPVLNFKNYGNGGVGGDVCGESVLVGGLTFLQEMGVEIPEGTMVNQAVYAAIDGQLCAVVAISYAKMRSAAAGMVTLSGYRRLVPVVTGADFILTESYIRTKFGIKTKRLLFPDAETRQDLAARQADPELPTLALATREDLVSYAYAVTGSRALRSSATLGTALHLFGGILGLLIMAVLAILGNTELLTPFNIFLYQLVWMIPGLLITEWTRSV